MVNHPSIAQCLTSLIQMGLVDLLSSFDVRPRAVVGHSMGEIAAAYVSLCTSCEVLAKMELDTALVC